MIIGQLVRSKSVILITLVTHTALSKTSHHEIISQVQCPLTTGIIEIIDSVIPGIFWSSTIYKQFVCHGEKHRRP